VENDNRRASPQHEHAILNGVALLERSTISWNGIEAQISKSKECVMKGRNSCSRRRPVLAVLGVGVFAITLAVQGEPPPHPRTKHYLADIEGTGTTGELGRVTAGPGVPLDDSVPMFAPVVVDYRDKDPVAHYGADVRAVGLGNLAVWEPYGTLARADSGDPCVIDEQCYTCNVCVEYECAGYVCAEDVLADETGVEGCDDGEYCNGEEVCDGGVCLPGTAVTCAAGEYCDDYEDQCRGECPGVTCNDNLYCTTDTCNGTQCEHTNACGPGAWCVEPVPPATMPVCIDGRCCTPTKACSRTTYANCPSGSNWLGAGGSATTCDDEPCPVYGAGIVADSNLTAEIGPISNTDCDVLVTVGDDYETWEHASLPPDEQYMLVERLRWVASVEPGAQDGARWSIEFRDENGVFIENVFFPNGQNDEGDFGIRTAVFDPPLAIPTKGIVSFTVQANFGLDGRVNLWATDAETIGFNDETTMYIRRRGEPVAIRDYLGVCSGGPPPPNDDGKTCDRANGHADCDGGLGTCNDLNDILAFELIGSLTMKPEGACCNRLDGTCTQRLPWECVGAFQGEGSFCGYCDGDSPDPGAPCTPGSNDCDPGLCIPIPVCGTAACCDLATGTCEEVTLTTECDDPDGAGPLTGTEKFLGFGTDCDPNCCEQPVKIGADNCRDAELTMPYISVPLLTMPPVLNTATITGNNSAATFDDANLICLDGPLQGNACNNGGVADDELCGQCIGGGNGGQPCDEDSDCPYPFPGACVTGDCGALCGAGFMDPEGTTRDPGWWNAFHIDACAEVRVDLCCTDISGDALRPAWGMLYGHCPCADAQATVGVPPPIGDGRGTAGFARGGPFCDEDNLWMTYLLPAGTYYYPIYSALGGTSGVPPGTDYQLHITVKACPIAVCCTGNDCAIMNELECAALDGYWMYGTVDCGTDTDCEDPPEETDNPCCIGACCLGLGWCLDETPGGAPMTEPDCVIMTGEDPPPYIGGATCDDDPFPCPLCPIESAENCQETAEATVYIADTRAVEELRRADDFIATWETIYQVCVTGSWIDEDVPCVLGGDGNRCDCACRDLGEGPGDPCLPQVNDTFTVCIYEDAGLAPPRSSLPGDLVACSGASMERENNSAPDESWNFDEWTIGLVLDSGIGPLTIGDIYWFSVSDDTDALSLDNTCYWYWARDGMLDDPNEEPGGNDWHVFDFNQTWEGTDGESVDMAFCLDQRIEPPPIPALGACCLCDPLGDCVDGTTLAECDEMLGAWQIAEVCTPNPCPQVRPINDDCTVYMQEVTDGLTAFNNLCATTDGPDSLECENADPTTIGADVWFKYKATCSGVLNVSMCANADFDSALAVYTDRSTTAAVRPTDDTYLVECGDDTCWIMGGPPEVECRVTKDVWYTLQFAGWRDTRGFVPECVNGCQGSGSFTIECIPDGACPPSSQPRPDPVPDPCDVGYGTKNRYLTFAGGDAGRQQAVRVTFISLPSYNGPWPPAPYDFTYAEGWTKWVQAPFLVSEAAGSAGPWPPPCFLAAELDSTPYYRDWTTGACNGGVCVGGLLDAMRWPCTLDDECRRVDVHDAGIVHEGIYHVQFIDSDPGCLITNEAHYSNPLEVTMSEPGDVCGLSSLNAPQGDVDFVDIAAVVSKFKNEPVAIRKARADITGYDPRDALVNQLVDFVDIACVVGGFMGDPCVPAGP
jgi:hypothetical protein